MSFIIVIIIGLLLYSVLGGNNDAVVVAQNEEKTSTADTVNSAILDDSVPYSPLNEKLAVLAAQAAAAGELLNSQATVVNPEPISQDSVSVDEAYIEHLIELKQKAKSLSN